MSSCMSAGFPVPHTEDLYRFVVDAADEKMFGPAKKELSELLEKPALVRIPLLVLMNKQDLGEAVDPDTIAQSL